MSPKELMYIDDCLGHLEFVNSLCLELMNEVSDENMKELVDCTNQKCESQFQKLYKLVENA